MSYYIKKITVSGNGKTSSSINFSSGVNIIYGPSNSGKTMIFSCINYVLGNEEEPFENITGYDCIDLVFVDKEKGNQVIISRKLNTAIVNVSSDYEKISSGEYSLDSRDNYEETLNSVILKLFGINEQHKLNKNSSFVKQQLTWLSFDHMFFIDEDKIIKKRSPLLSEQFINQTMNLSSLLFLLTGKDYSDVSTIEKKEIKQAKKNAIKKYLMDEMQEFSMKIENLKREIELINYDDIDTKISCLLDNIHSIEAKINILTNENKEYAKKNSFIK